MVVADVEVEDEYQFERRWYGNNPEQMQRLGEWLIQQEVEEVVMASTAQYWKPVWGALERYWKPSSGRRSLLFGEPGAHPLSHLQIASLSELWLSGQRTVATRALGRTAEHGL